MWIVVIVVMKLLTLTVFIFSQRLNDTPNMRKELKHRSAIKPVICHRKEGGNLSLNWLKGISGDEIYALLCAASRNIRVILRKLREIVLFIVYLTVIKKFWNKRVTRPYGTLAMNQC